MPEPANRFADYNYRGFTLKHAPGKGWRVWEGSIMYSDGPFSSRLGCRCYVDALIKERAKA